MKDLNRLIKLITKLDAMKTKLDHEGNLVVHQNINQFYYMQKAIELKVLCEQLTEVTSRTQVLHERLEIEYTKAFLTWQKDYRWLNDHLRSKLLA